MMKSSRTLVSFMLLLIVATYADAFKHLPSPPYGPYPEQDASIFIHTLSSNFVTENGGFNAAVNEASRYCVNLGYRNLYQCVYAVTAGIYRDPENVFCFGHLPPGFEHCTIHMTGTPGISAGPFCIKPPRC